MSFFLPFFVPVSTCSIVVVNLGLLRLQTHHNRSLFHALSLGTARAEQVDPFRRVKGRRPKPGGVERDGHVFFFFFNRSIDGSDNVCQTDESNQ